MLLIFIDDTMPTFLVNDFDYQMLFLIISFHNTACLFSLIDSNLGEIIYAFGNAKYSVI